MKSYKGESTRDIICLDFDFGSRSYEEELAHITKMIDADPENPRLQDILQFVTDNKDKYIKKSKDEIRELFYREGVDVRYDTRNREGEVIRSETIHYKMLYRNASKAKLGQAMFIREALWKKSIDWLSIGLYRKMPATNAKIVELSAYMPLTTSTIVDKIHIPVEDILILEDQDSFFKTVSKVVYAEVGADGKKHCAVKDGEVEVKNTLWDGMALIDIDSIPRTCEANGMVLLRGHMFKACAFKSRLQQFFRDNCPDYDTRVVYDMFGNPHRLRDVKVITTDNAIKFKKFRDIMGDDPYGYWCDRVNADGSYWGIVKTDHPSKLGNVQQMSYQMINTLPCTYDEVGEIARTSIEYVELLKSDPEEFAKFLIANATEVNHYDMLAALYYHNPIFADSKFFRTDKRFIINQYVHKLRGGKITVNADNLTACGNPYALLLYAIGKDWKSDPTLTQEDGCIQCYTTRFADGEYLCGFRSPHNSPNNCVYLHNVHSDIMQKYFMFSPNIIALNNIGTDIQSRCNGADYDSDFLFVTDHPTLVEGARRCYAEYPTIVNDLKESGLTYDNTPEEFARMDNNLSKSRRGIGESSNLAQLAMSYYWTCMLNGETGKHVDDLYDNFVILSVVAQIIIDSSKREYEVDSLAEIDRIKRMDCMNPVNEDGQKKDFPMFMKYTKAVPTTKNNRELPYEEISKTREKIKNRINPELVCPMNYLQTHLDKIQGASTRSTIPTEDFFVKMIGKSNERQVSKIVRLAAEYTHYITENQGRLNEVGFADELLTRTEQFYAAVAKIKIGNPVTMNRIVEAALNLNTITNKGKDYRHLGIHKYGKLILKALYKTKPEMFLANFYGS